jgi:DNA-binding winged helix-turn-helix (wHTH) protein/tetratricopeptide (TPR) repeat protein
MLAMSGEPKHFYEFGAFRVDPDKRILLRDNQPVALQPKAFETLLVLVQNSGTVVLKDDLMKTLWPDSFVEESNLTQHIFVLRKSLGETAGENRYIATIPGRGHQFAEKVRLVPEHEDVVVQSRSVTRVLIEAESSPHQIPPTNVPPAHVLVQTRTKQVWHWLAFAAVTVAASLGGAWYWRSHRLPKLTQKDTIVVADFDNRTGDPVFDGTLKDALVVELDQSPYLNVVSDQKISEGLKLMGRERGQRITGEFARDLCQRVSSNATLQGSIANLGGQYLVVLTVANCATGDTLASEQVRAESKEKILPVVDRAASSLRRKLGESLSSIAKYDTPVEQATTPSLAALQAYSAGVKIWGIKGSEAAIPFYKRAIELDPNFAMAYAHLGQSYANLGVPGAMENMNKAFTRRDRLSERERFYIDSRYYDIVTGDKEKTVRVLEQWRLVYPREWWPARALVFYYRQLGRYEDALREAEESVRLEPADPNYEVLVFADLTLNRLDEAQSVLKEWQARFPDSLWQTKQLYLLAFLRSDLGGMQKQSARGVGADGEADFLSEQSDTEAYHGRVRKARELIRRAMKSGAGDKENAGLRAANREIDGAVLEAVLGYTGQAQREATASLNLSRDDGIQEKAALAFALAGDTKRAKTITDDLAKRYPLDTMDNMYWFPTIRATIQLSRNNPAKAAQELEITSRYELGDAWWWSIAPLFPVYVRGQAFLALHQGREAADEFQKYIDHPGAVMNYPLGALARVGLARAYAVQGDTVKARAAYQDFFSLWKDADPDVPILKQAKAEYAKLQ